MSETPHDEFVGEISRVLNSRSRENVSNTPDHILGSFAAQAIALLDEAIQRRDAWYGIAPRPGMSSSAEFERGRLAGLEQAAKVAEQWFEYGPEQIPDEIRALASTPEPGHG